MIHFTDSHWGSLSLTSLGMDKANRSSLLAFQAVSIAVRFSRSWACCLMSGPGTRLGWECLGPMLVPMLPGSAIMIAGILETETREELDIRH